VFTRDDLIDAILARLERPGAARKTFSPGAVPAASPAAGAARKEARPFIARGRSFLTEFDIKKALTPGTEHLTIPKDAIVSPLAQEWLDLKGIAITRT